MNVNPSVIRDLIALAKVNPQHTLARVRPLDIIPKDATPETLVAVLEAVYSGRRVSTNTITVEVEHSWYECGSINFTRHMRETVEIEVAMEDFIGDDGEVDEEALEEHIDELACDQRGQGDIDYGDTDYGDEEIDDYEDYEVRNTSRVMNQLINTAREQGLMGGEE